MDSYTAPAAGAVAAAGLRQAIDTALHHGITADEIQSMVAQRIIPDYSVASPDDILRVLDHAEADAEAHCGQQVTPNSPSGDYEVIYPPDAVPDGLIDLPSAARKYGIPAQQLYMWVVRGKLPRMGRVKAPAPGKGYILTDEAMIPYCRDNPRKRGRKKIEKIVSA